MLNLFSISIFSVLRPLIGSFLEKMNTLDTLLATWGLSLILQQTYRTVFGPREVGVTLPDWLMGSYQLTETIELPINGLFVMCLALGISLAVALLMYRSR